MGVPIFEICAYNEKESTNTKIIKYKTKPLLSELKIIFFAISHWLIQDICWEDESETIDGKISQNSEERSNSGNIRQREQDAEDRREFYMWLKKCWKWSSMRGYLIIE